MALFGTKKTTQADPLLAAKKSKKDAPQSEPVVSSMKDLYAEGAAKISKTKTKVTTPALSSAYRILVRPLITEKATNLTSENKYIFVVERSVNKIDVAKAIQVIYGVKPLAVNLLNVSGKAVRRGKISGRRKNWRKAIVTLAKGETIKIYEGV